MDIKIMLTIEAKIRKKYGKSINRRFRIENKLPAIIYGGNIHSTLAIILDHNQILNLQTKEEFYKDKIQLIVEGKKNQVKLQDIQYHPFKLKIIHIDFIRI